MYERVESPKKGPEDPELERLIRRSGYCVHDGWIMDRKQVDDYDHLIVQSPPRSMAIKNQLKQDFSNLRNAAMHLAAWVLLLYGIASANRWLAFSSAAVILVLAYFFMAAL